MSEQRERRYRDFATVVYPESAPDGWLDTLKDTHIPCFVSPLHDKDKNPDGEDKKPHYHVMLMFPSVKTRDQAIEIFSQIGGVGCETIATRRGYARYLIHKDNPEKYQYEEKDVIALSGCDYYEVISLVSDKYIVLNEVINFIRSEKVDNVLDVYAYASENGFLDWIRIIQDKSFVVNMFCNANYQRNKEILRVMSAQELVDYHNRLNGEESDPDEA